MGDHRGSWRWQSSSSLTIKPQAAVSDLPTMQHIFKRAQFWPVKNRQLRADVFQESGKTRAYLGRRVWRRAALTAHQPAEHTHYINCFWLSLSLSLRLPPSFSLLSWSLYLISPSLCLPVWWIQISGEVFVSPPSSLLTNTLRTHQSSRRRRFIHTRGISAGHVPVSLTNTHSSITGGQPTAVTIPEAKREWRKEKRGGDEWGGTSYKERAHADRQRQRVRSLCERNELLSDQMLSPEQSCSRSACSHTPHWADVCCTDPSDQEVKMETSQQLHEHNTHTNRHVRLLRNPVTADGYLPAATWPLASPHCSVVI